MRNWLHGGDLEGGRVTKDGRPVSSGHATGGIARRLSGALHRDDKKKKRVVVVHCKAGKGRSGTVSCSYLISEEGWTAEDALARFTERRMRPKFGAGVSIPSQLRWISYVDRWTKGGKKFFDRPIEIVEIHVWGLRNGVKVDIEGFAEEGKKIQVFHTFKKEERIVIEGDPPEGTDIGTMMWELAGYTAKHPKENAPEEADFSADTNLDNKQPDRSETAPAAPGTEKTKEGRGQALKRKGTDLLHKVSPASSSQNVDKSRSKTAVESSASSTKSADAKTDPSSGESEPGGKAVILKPAEPVRIPNSDVNISVERRNKTPKSMGLTMVTAVAHVWFNTFFEGQGPEQDGKSNDSGVFSIEWDAMDGIKGSSRKGSRAMDRIAVVWRVADTGVSPVEIVEPEEGQPVPQLSPADWKGSNHEDPEAEKDLGLRTQSPASADVSKASSIRSVELPVNKKLDERASIEGVRTSDPTGQEFPSDGKLGKKHGKEAERKSMEKETEPQRTDQKDLLDNPDTASGTTQEGTAKVV